jgi:two-component system, cell cycle sensor histidine kinase and response regulator CckA
MRKNILVVDDHPLIVKMMSTLLENEGHRVVTAVDGLSALDALKGFTPDVIFLDLIMPNIGGEKLCRIIRTMPELENAHVVILSGIAMEEKTDFAGFGANACIAKGPFGRMAQQVLAALQNSDAKLPKTRPELILGSGALHPRQMTKELLAVKRHFEVLLESMSEGILEVTQDARIVYANPAALSLIGLPEGELLTRRLSELFSGEDRRRLETLIEMIGPSQQCLFEDTPLTLKGKQLSVKILPIKDEPHKAIVTLNNVTDQKRMEKELEQARKMDAIGTLAGGVAHGFNNALTVIIGNISLAKMYAKPGGKVLEKLEEAERASLKARDLTQQLMPFSDGTSPVMDTTSISEVLKDICLFALADTQARCELSIPDDLWLVKADPVQIQQVISNVVVNAAEVMSWNGVVKTSADNFVCDDEHGLALSAGKYVRISVSDHGPGIPEDCLSRIYDPYFTTREMGRGLGLATAYCIIRKHDGLITAKSEPGRGTRFDIFLPATDRATVLKKDHQAKADSGRGRVLLMDDDETVREIVGEMLKSLGYSTRFACEGGEAIMLYLNAREFGEPFDVVILDLNVSLGIGGLEAIKKLLIIDPQAKVIVSSGYTADPVMLRCRNYGFKGALDKPFKMGDLESLMERVRMQISTDPSPNDVELRD